MRQKQVLYFYLSVSAFLWALFTVPDLSITNLVVTIFAAMLMIGPVPESLCHHDIWQLSFR